MDQYLELTLDWFRSFGIEPNIEKLKKQLSIITNWFNNNAKGVLLAVTGFGKTYVALITIFRLNRKYPNMKTIVIVPSIKLHQDWREHVMNFNLQNVEVYVVNTYVEIWRRSGDKHECDLLVADEVHNYLGVDAEVFNKAIRCTNYRMFLGMSATLNDAEKVTLLEMDLPIIGEITMSEARRMGYVSNYRVYNLGIRLSEEKRAAYDKVNDIHNKNFAKFTHFMDSNKNFELLRACCSGNDVPCRVGDEVKSGKEWRIWYADTQKWNGKNDHVWSPNNIAKYANLWNWAMVERKGFLYKGEEKIDIAKQITDIFKAPTITFAENIEFADKLAIAIGPKAGVYHSGIKGGTTTETIIESRKTEKAAQRIRQRNKVLDYKFNKATKSFDVYIEKLVKISAKKVKEDILRLFEKGELDVICTAKALDEGFNIENIRIAIICSATSKQRQDIQRKGRAIRYVEGKEAIIINLYYIETQDESWLKRRQKSETNIEWIESINQIKWTI